MGVSSSNTNRQPSKAVAGTYPSGQPPMQPGYPNAPPAYQPAGQPVPQQGVPYGQPAPYGQPVPQQAPPYGQPAPYQLQQHRPSQGTFDQGARFDPNKPVNIPPPPPGCAPTAAQMAVAQGQPVVMNQQKQDVWGMGSDGGYTVI